MTDAQPKNKKIRTQLYLVVIVFFLPVLAGSLLYHYHANFSLGTTNHGVFINPPVSVQDIAIGKENQGKWRILHIDNGQCDTQCADVNFQLGQVKKALGKNTDRVRVMTHHGVDTVLQKKFPDNNFVVTNKIFLIDPLGNVFMYYPDTTNPMNILKDVKKVLEVSQIG